LNLAKCGIDILVGYFGLANGGNLNIGVKEVLAIVPGWRMAVTDLAMANTLCDRGMKIVLRR
jgi:hypothetical protein